MDAPCVMILEPGGHKLTEGDLDRLPVLAALVEDVSDTPVSWTIPSRLSVDAILEFLYSGEDFLLHMDPVKADVQRSTLDFLGVDVSGMRTAKQLREEFETLREEFETLREESETLREESETLKKKSATLANVVNYFATVIDVLSAPVAQQ